MRGGSPKKPPKPRNRRCAAPTEATSSRLRANKARRKSRARSTRLVYGITARAATWRELRTAPQRERRLRRKRLYTEKRRNGGQGRSLEMPCLLRSFSVAPFLRVDPFPPSPP